MDTKLIQKSDGISGDDWEQVKSISLAIANAIMLDQSDEALAALQDEMQLTLDTLAQKYGERASILATRADYMDDHELRLELLVKAYSLADKNKDHMDRTLISSSIAELLIDEMGDLERGKEWITVLAASLKLHFDHDEYAIYEALTAKLAHKSA